MTTRLGRPAVAPGVVLEPQPSPERWVWASQLLSAPWVLILVAALALAAYGSGLSIGFVSDDNYWLLSAVRGGWRHAFDLAPHSSALPGEIVLHTLKYRLFGFNAVGFHLLDLGAHIVVCFLVYQVARGGVGLPSPAAGAAALLGAVATSPAQAVYWTSADEHVWATLLALAALALYFKYRTGGHRLPLAGAILLAAVAAMTKVEGTAALFGVLAYELVWRPHGRWSRHDIGALALRVAPFGLAAGLFVAWELTATDRLRSASHLGPNMIRRAAEVLSAIVLPYSPTDLLAPAHTQRALAWLAALAAVGVAALLVVCIVAAFARSSVIGLCLLWVGPQLPMWSLTDALQTRYTYLPTLVTFLFVASGASVLLDWLIARTRLATLARSLAAIALVGLLVVGIRDTAQSSTNLRVAERESRAFSSAVLRDHPVLMPRTTIYLIGSPLDVGSATWVFADPRLGRHTNDSGPLIEYAPSVEAVARRLRPPLILMYERDPAGAYVERFFGS